MKPNTYFIEGAGNTFVAIVDCMVEFDDVRSDTMELARGTLSRCADRADSLLYLTPAKDATFGMRVFERDGSESVMCGNGIRACALLLSKLRLDRLPVRYDIRTKAGVRSVSITSDKGIEVSIGTCTLHDSVSIGGRLLRIGDVGEPHACLFDPVSDDEFFALGRLLTSEASPVGTVNLNLVRRYGQSLAVRTFERGVRAETASCGSGSFVSACIARTVFPDLSSIFLVKTRGGTLRIDTERGILAGPAIIKDCLP